MREKIVSNEKHLIEKLKRGDNSGFRELFLEYESMVFRICYRILGNTEEAEDLTQDVFIKVYNSMSKFRFESKLSTWLYRISTNLSLNYLRKKKIVDYCSLEFLSEKNEEKLVLEGNNVPDENLEILENERIIQKVINSLSGKQKVAIILQIYEGFSYKEIAEIMKCTIPAVESHLFKARKNIAKKLLILT